MTQTVDTNILVYAADETCAQHQRCQALLEHVATSPSITYLFWPVLAGYLRIITHPGIVTRPLTPEVVVADIDKLIARPQIVVVAEGERFWRSFRSVIETVQPRGKLVPDAHIVALMAEHGVSTIWSNDRDFRKFDGITVRNPLDAKYSAGFDR